MSTLNVHHAFEMAVDEALQIANFVERTYNLTGTKNISSNDVPIQAKSLIQKIKETPISVSSFVSGGGSGRG